jgi:hypothetical protein
MISWSGLRLQPKNEKLRPELVVKSQPVPQSVRPKLDVGPFVKLGDRTAAGRGRELCALRSQRDFRNACPIPAGEPIK